MGRAGKLHTQKAIQVTRMERTVAEAYVANDTWKVYLIFVPGMLRQGSNNIVVALGHIRRVVRPSVVTSQAIFGFDESDPCIRIPFQQEPCNQTVLKATAHEKMIEGLSREFPHH